MVKTTHAHFQQSIDAGYARVFTKVHQLSSSPASTECICWLYLFANLHIFLVQSKYWSSHSGIGVPEWLQYLDVGPNQVEEQLPHVAL